MCSRRIACCLHCGGEAALGLSHTPACTLCGPCRPFLVNQTDLPAWLEAVQDPAEYEAARNGTSYSYQSFSLWKSIVTCFAPDLPGGSAAGCTQVSASRAGGCA